MDQLKRMSFVLFTAFVFSLTLASSSYAALPSDSPVFVKEYLGQVGFVEGRLLQLEGAMAQDQMTWTPMEGVRTVAEVYLHIAESNYLLVNFLKGEKMEGESNALEKTTTNKDEIAKILSESFTAVKEAAGKVTQEQLDKVVQTPFGMKTSVRDFMVMMLGHTHEHLGQGIAYARMNGVVPPWSRKESEGK